MPISIRIWICHIHLFPVKQSLWGSKNHETPTELRKTYLPNYKELFHAISWAYSLSQCDARAYFVPKKFSVHIICFPWTVFQEHWVWKVWSESIVDYVALGSTFEGAISEMYKGTRAEESPIPRPTRILPATMALMSEAVAERRDPAKVGRAAKIRAFLRPRESANPLPDKLPTVAPAKQLETTYNRFSSNTKSEKRILKRICKLWCCPQIIGKCDRTQSNLTL